MHQKEPLPVSSIHTATALMPEPRGYPAMDAMDTAEDPITGGVTPPTPTMPMKGSAKKYVPYTAPPNRLTE